VIFILAESSRDLEQALADKSEELFLQNSENEEVLSILYIPFHTLITHNLILSLVETFLNKLYKT
jgi:hypothetical protein